MLAGVVVLSGLALLPAVSGPWILDDGPLIASNARVQTPSAANVLFLLTHDMWDLDVSSAQLAEHLVYYRPLVMLSYLSDWVIGGGSSVTFHVTNLLLHALTVLLAGRAVWRWSGSHAGAVLAAAYFGLHPARAESAAWISGRPDVLATLGLLLCVEGVAALRRARAAPGIALFFGGALIAFASKETALLLPLLVAIELGAARGPSSLGPDWRRAWPLATSFVVTASYLLARQLWLPMRPFPMKGLALEAHVGFVFETLGRAAMFLLAPFDLSLSGPILTERAGKVAPDPRYLVLGVVTAVVVVVALVWSRRRKPQAFWALGAFSISVLPTLNIVWIGGIGLTSARFFYLPALLLGWFAVELAKGAFVAVSPLLKVATSSLGIATLTLLLTLQSASYRSTDQFWTSELRSRPDVPMNIDYFVERDWQRGDPARAFARSLCEYQIALERFSFRGEGASIILSALEPWARLLPDAAHTELRAIADFLAAARQPDGLVELQLSFSLQIPAQSKVRQALRSKAALAQTQEAAIRVRLGERTRALELVRAARSACPRCADLLERQAYVAYLARDADYAEELARGTPDSRWGGLPKREAIARLRAMNAAVSQASGPAQLQLKVQRLAALELYGEALRLLQRARSDQAAAGAPDPALDKVTLTFAARAGSRELSEQLAQALNVAPPPLPVAPSLGEAQRLLSQLHNGCAFPEELE